jgi:hypothetical protein
MSKPHDHSVRILGFEAQARYGEDSAWTTIRVTQLWSAVEDALERAAQSVDPFGRPAVETRVVTVDHSRSVDPRLAF